MWCGSYWLFGLLYVGSFVWVVGLYGIVCEGIYLLVLFLLLGVLLLVLWLDMLYSLCSVVWNDVGSIGLWLRLLNLWYCMFRFGILFSCLDNCIVVFGVVLLIWCRCVIMCGLFILCLL